MTHIWHSHQDPGGIARNIFMAYHHIPYGCMNEMEEDDSIYLRQRYHHWEHAQKNCRNMLHMPEQG